MTKVRLASVSVCLATLSAVMVSLAAILPALGNAPPVRIAVVPAGGSGIEQEAVDRISSQLQDMQNVVISTVNPDWYVVCNIQENTNQMSGAIRYNGTVTVKTTDGQVVSNIAVQKYNQDFSLEAGTPLNKKLVDNAARDVIGGMSDRAMGPLQQAIQTEMDTREKVISASEDGDKDQYNEAIGLLAQITPDSTHFKQVHGMIMQFEVEKHCMELCKSAQAKAGKGAYGEAINLLRQVDKRSKRYKFAQGKIAAYRAASGAHAH
ncbi:MAG TPA: hypothetical protein V6C69_08475 [Trichormus sp.]